MNTASRDLVNRIADRVGANAARSYSTLGSLFRQRAPNRDSYNMGAWLHDADYNYIVVWVNGRGETLIRRYRMLPTDQVWGTIAQIDNLETKLGRGNDAASARHPDTGDLVM